MILEFDRYLVTTDDKQFKIKDKKSKIKLNGKINYKTIAYCTTLEATCKFLAKRISLDNKEVKEILEKLDKLYKKVEELEAKDKWKKINR